MNRHDRGGGGLGWCNGLIQNNLILRNSAHYGGGLNSCYGSIQNNTIVGNWPDGLYWCTNMTIVNCIIRGNHAPNGQELFNCAEPTQCCIRNWTGGGLGNTAADPQFVNAAKDDYRLLPSSPGIDAGDSLAANLPATDFLGRPRILYGARRLAVDLGAYGFIPTACALSPGLGQVTVTWGSLAGKTYWLFCSHDLRQWELADDRVQWAGSLTSAWSDDGTQTGAPPGAVPCRFCRCVENP